MSEQSRRDPCACCKSDRQTYPVITGERWCRACLGKIKLGPLPTEKMIGREIPSGGGVRQMSECEYCGWKDKPDVAASWPVPHRYCSDTCLSSAVEALDSIGCSEPAGIPWQPHPVPADAEPGTWWLVWGKLDGRIQALLIEVEEQGDVPLGVAQVLHVDDGGDGHEPGTVGTHCCRIQPPEDQGCQTRS